MLDIMKVNLYPKTINEIAVSKDKKHHIIFYSENSTFKKVYNMLKIRKAFVKKVSIIPNKIPRLIFDASAISEYKSLKLMPSRDLKSNKENIFIDTSKFLDLVDSKYGKKSYQRSIVLTKIIDYLNMCRVKDAENVLLYHADLSKDLPAMPQLRRSWPLIAMANAGDGRFPFDCVAVCLTLNGNVRYFSIYNKNMKKLSASKIFNIFKSIKKGKGKVEEEPKQEKLSHEEPKQEEPKKINSPSIKQLHENMIDRLTQPEDLRNEDMLGDIKYTSTEELIRQIKENERLNESTQSISATSKALQKVYKSI